MSKLREKFRHHWPVNDQKRSQSRHPKDRPSKHLILFMAFIMILMVMGGSSRADMSTLIVIRPLAIVMLGYASMRITPNDWHDNRFVFGMALAIVALPILQLLPLPPSIWGDLSGRSLIREVDAAAGLSGTWRPLTFSPSGTWNALFSLSVPASVLVAGQTLSKRERLGLVPFMLAIVLASAVLGLLQIIGPKGGALYFHRITQPDSAVGFLANRNHHAAFIATAFPMLAVLISDPDFKRRFYGRPITALLIGAFLLPMVMVIGSRTGIAVTCVAIAIAFALYRSGNQAGGHSLTRRNAAYLALGGGAVGLVGVAAILLGRAEAVQRLIAWDSENDLRLLAWIDIAAFTRDYWPWGTGFGSFVDVYKIHERRELLIPAYFNQAHNDWLEVLLNGGIGAALLLAIAFLAWVRRAWQVRSVQRLEKQSNQLPRLGLSILLLFALASITDYPLRVPSMAAVFIIALLWALPSRPDKSVKEVSNG